MIKFTVEISDEQINFLDTTLHLTTSGAIWTDLYTKPTDSHNYLQFESSHPKHCRSNLPYSQFLGLCRTCSRQSDFDVHSTILKVHFSQRGYPLPILEKALKAVQLLNRDNVLLPARTTTSQAASEPVNKLFAITTYHPTEKSFKNILQEDWDLVGAPATRGLYEAKVV